MERQLPKNVRQIGNVSDSPKIYVGFSCRRYSKRRG